MPRKPFNNELLELMQMLSGEFMLDPAFEDPDELRRNVAELPLRPETRWLGFVEPMDMSNFPIPEGLTPHMAVLLRPEGPEASLSELAEDYADAELMLLQEIVQPDGEDVEVYRPGVLLVPDAQQAFVLSNVLRDTGIKVEVEPTDELTKLRRSILSQFAQEAATQVAKLQPQTLFTGLTDDEVQDFVAAFRHFMQAKAWNVVQPDKAISATWTDAAGVRRTIYATAMGDMGESFGLAFFDDWLAYSEQINSSFSQELVLSGLGGMEAVTEGGKEELSQEDWARLKQLGLERGPLPTLQRVGLEGTMPPHTPLPVATALLSVLSERAERKKGGRASSIKGSTGGVEVRYPGKPEDELSAEELSGTITLAVGDVTISGPAHESMTELYKYLRFVPELRGNVPFRLTRPVPLEAPQPGLPFEADDLFVWEYGPNRPKVLLTQLTRREGLEWQRQPLTVSHSATESENFSWHKR